MKGKQAREMVSAALLLTLLVLAGCGQSRLGNTSSPAVSDIDPGITGLEREKIANVMQGLTTQQRQNVVFIDEDGKIYSNRVELKQDWYSPKKVGDNLYELRSGERIYGMPQGTDRQGLEAQAYPCKKSDGPYYRVHTAVGKKLGGVSIGKYAYANALVDVRDNPGFANNGLSAYVTLGG